MKEVSLKEMIKPNPNNLNLFWNERRLLVLALIKADFKIEGARDLNAPDMNLETYKTNFARCGLSIKRIKKEYQEIINSIIA